LLEGRLLRVVRNPLHRTLTFEGEVPSRTSGPVRSSSTPELPRRAVSVERLVVQIPPGFDLVGPPAHVERSFAEGRCHVMLHRSGAHKSARPQSLSWAGGDL
jgi:hypothetical protein